MPNGKVIFHIDSNFLLNYLIPDNPDLNQAVKSKLERNNWSNDVYRINKLALGECFKRVITYEYDSRITFDKVVLNITKIKKIISDGHLEIVDAPSLNNGFNTHYGEIEELDTHIQDADKLIIAMFCADQDAIILYSFDKMIINSEKIIKYVKEIGKKIKEVT